MSGRTNLCFIQYYNYIINYYKQYYIVTLKIKIIINNIIKSLTVENVNAWKKSWAHVAQYCHGDFCLQQKKNLWQSLELPLLVFIFACLLICVRKHVMLYLGKKEGETRQGILTQHKSRGASWLPPLCLTPG